MGQAKREMDEHSEYIETARVLLEMLKLLRTNKTMSVPDLYAKAKFTLAVREETQAELDELHRKMEKDD